MKTKHLFQLALAGLASFAVIIGVACGSDEGEKPPPIVGNDTGTDTGGGGDSITPPDSATDSGTPTDSTAEGGDVGDTTPPWDPDSGKCFPGTPSKTIEYLNACTTAACVKWTAKLTKLKPDGTLPDLP